MGKGVGRVDVRINGMSWVPRADCGYMFDYADVYRRVLSKESGWREENAYRYLFLNDLWFLVYFGLRWPGAHHPFVVNACREVQLGPRTQTLDAWFREAGKSTIITIGQTIQDVLNNPNERVGIFSYTKSAAVSFIRQIRWVLESSEILKSCFPDVLYANPEKESPKWADTEGLLVKRSGYFKELTFEGHGLIDGMPTGKHFSLIVDDDISTADLVQTPDMMEKVKERFDLHINLGTSDGRQRVVGTFYMDNDVLCYVRDKKGKDGAPLYHYRRKPATVDGSLYGRSVFLPESRLDLLRSNLRTFSCQQLLDPVPMGEGVLRSSMLNVIDTSKIPSRLYKFMVVDSAGQERLSDGKSSDRWACWLVGVSPRLNQSGLVDVYILDGFLESMSVEDAIRRIVTMYMRAGKVLKLGVEKVGAMTFELHISNALKQRGYNVSVERGNLELLMPRSRKKEKRIEDALLYPFANGTIHMSTNVKSEYRDVLCHEMNRFGAGGKDDGLDALSYVYDIIKEYRFGKREDMDVAFGGGDKFPRYNGANGIRRTWMTA